MYWEPFVSLFFCWQAALWLFLPATISPPQHPDCSSHLSVPGSTSRGLHLRRAGVAGALAEADDGWRVWSE